MRAAVLHSRGDVRVEERPALRSPPAEHVLLEIRRASLCGTDVAEYDHGPVLASLHERHPHSGHHGPVVLGHEFVGRVLAAGKGAEIFATGERVVSGAGVSCDTCERCAEGRTNLCARYYTLGLHRDGGLAERALVPASTCVRVPDSCSDDSAALAQPMAVAIHALNRGDVCPGRTLVVNGAGGIGAFAVAAAVHRGVERIIACDVDTERLVSAERLGASDLLDVRHCELSQAVRKRLPLGADVIIEASGVPGAPAACLNAVRDGGIVVIVGLQPQPVALDLLTVSLHEIEVRGTLAHVCATDIPEALQVLTPGTVARTIVERVIALEDIVPRGLAPLLRREVAGKILVDPQRPSSL